MRKPDDAEQLAFEAATIRDALTWELIVDPVAQGRAWARLREIGIALGLGGDWT